MNAIRFKGGPLDGETHIAPNEWPMPELFTMLLHSVEDGIGLQLGGYRKVSQSALTDEQADHPGIMRGALYEWEVDYDGVFDGATVVAVGDQPVV